MIRIYRTREADSLRVIVKNSVDAAYVFELSDTVIVCSHRSQQTW